ncbi:MAG: hypothetical protein HUJ79_05375 [Firmicutes bacterium]|nr:hypothetical protein [Bacillota bacterium]
MKKTISIKWYALAVAILLVCGCVVYQTGTTFSADQIYETETIQQDSKDAAAFESLEEATGMDLSEPQSAKALVDEAEGDDAGGDPGADVEVKVVEIE